MVLKAEIQVLGLGTQVLGLGLDSVRRLSANMLYTSQLRLLLTLQHYKYVPVDVKDGRPLEKIVTHYISTINSVSFDSDTKLADICSQMEFVPVGYLFERILAVPASSASVERVFYRSGLLVHPHCAKMSDKLLESLVFAKCSIFS